MRGAQWTHVSLLRRRDRWPPSRWSLSRHWCALAATWRTFVSGQLELKRHFWVPHMLIDERWGDVYSVASGQREEARFNRVVGGGHSNVSKRKAIVRPWGCGKCPNVKKTKELASELRRELQLLLLWIKCCSFRCGWERAREMALDQVLAGARYAMRRARLLNMTSWSWRRDLLVEFHTSRAHWSGGEGAAIPQSCSCLQHKANWRRRA